MRIGGTAAYYAELSQRDDVEVATAFAREKGIPLIPLGGGSNTIFADGTIDALVTRITANNVIIEEASEANEANVTIEAGKNLPQLINELAEEGLDLSALTGILGTVGGAVFGNAGQGPKGIWIDEYIDTVDAYIDGKWKTLTKQECDFRYRESWFKSQPTTDPSESAEAGNRQLPVIWNTTLSIPKRDPTEIKTEIEQLLQRRLETQPHIKTAGSCFKAVGNTPAWQLIDAADLRDTAVGGIHISPKHANFLINDGQGTFDEAVEVVKVVQKGIPNDLEVEMRFVKEDGSLEF